MDSWYASQKLMAMIDNWGKSYYLKNNNRLVDDTKGVSKYKLLEKVQWTESELKSGKLIKMKNFLDDKEMKLFRVTVSPNRISCVVTNDKSQSDTTNVNKVCSER
jgi:hypothetical protein